MRFGVIHRIMTDALAVLGLLALLTSGELNPLVSGALVVGLLVALFLPSRYRQQRFSRWAGVVAPLALLGVQLVRLASGPDPIPIIVEFAAGLQVIRLATRRGAAHDQQVILLSLLHLIAGTVLGGGLAYALSFVGFLILTPGALVLSHLRREVEGNYRQGARDRTGLPVDVPRILRSRRVIGRSFLLFTCLLSVPVFLFTAVLFLLFPRVGVSLLMVQQARPTRVVGFSERVDLGGVGTLRSDPALALRVHFDDLPPDPAPRLNLYLRGAVFDRYDGHSWSRTPYLGTSPVDNGGSFVVLKRPPALGTDRTMRIDLQPIDPPVVFVPGDAVALRVITRKGEFAHREPQLFSGIHGELKYLQNDKRGLNYEVFLQGEQERLPELVHEDELGKYLQTPPDLSPRIRQLAETFAGEERSSALRTARAIEAALRTNYQYDLASPSGAASDPLVDFLFESKRGHCEFYSTAMVMMLRLLGIPARNVTGFVGGTFNRFGEFYAVRQGDAHSWVEAYLPSRGWTRFDPTPPSSAAPQAEVTGVFAFAREAVEAMAQRWSEHVIGYNLERQLSYLQKLRRHWRELSPARTSERSHLSGRRLLLVGAGLGVMFVGAWWLLRRRQNKENLPGPLTALPATLLRPIELYRKLEAALAAQGVARPPARPPLLHAKVLVEAGHPTGEEALALTKLYLRARFGGEPLTSAEERQFVLRVQALRTLRPAARDERAA